MTDEMETTWREARQPGNDVICLSCGGRMFSSPKEYWNGDEGRQDLSFSHLDRRMDATARCGYRWMKDVKIVPFSPPSFAEWNEREGDEPME